MSPLTIKFIDTMIINFAAILIVRKLIDSKENLITTENFFWILISALPSIIYYKVEYQFFTTVLMFLFLLVSIKKIFNIDIAASILLTIFTMIGSIIPDLIVALIMSNFIEFETMRNNLLLMTINTTAIAILNYFLFLIPLIKNIALAGVRKVQKDKPKKILVFSLTTFLTISVIYYGITRLFSPTPDYLIFNVIILVFVFLIFIYMSEIIRYDKLRVQNDVLCECMQNVEEYQEQQDLKMHEYKNQLSKLTATTKDKKVLSKLEEILQIDFPADNYILSHLKNLPKGEIKSLIYYKLLVATKHDITLLADISPKIKEDSLEFSKKIKEELSQLIGIYFDNAIEAALESEKKFISLEIYLMKSNLTIVIMNTYGKTLDLESMDEKGYTTKGIGHGKGLYFAKKIINHSNVFESENDIIGDYYAEKLTIKKSN